MKFKNFGFVCSLALGPVACTKNATSFAVLDPSAVPPPTFQGQSTLTLTPGARDVTVAVTGECDPRVRSLAATAIGGNGNGDLAQISTDTPVLRCAAGGTFSFTLRTLDALFSSPRPNVTYRVELRAVTEGGISTPAVILITAIKELPPIARMIAGGTESGSAARPSSSVHYRADLRLTHVVNADDARGNPTLTRATSSHYQLRYGRADFATR